MEINWGIAVSIASLLITVYTIIRTNAKTEEKTNAKIEIVQNDIKHLTSQVEKHNKVIERTYELEEKCAVLENRMKVEEHRMDDAEADIAKVNDRLTNTTRRNAI